MRAGGGGGFVVCAGFFMDFVRFNGVGMEGDDGDE